jgi:hypothetical protein
LQEAVATFLRAVVVLHSEGAEEAQRTGQWPTRRHWDNFPVGFDEHFARMQGLRARIFDDELRGLAFEVMTLAVKALEAEDGKTAKGQLTNVAAKNTPMTERMNVLLKELF